MDQLCLTCALTKNQTCSPGMCPDWELNQQSFALQNHDQPTEPQQSGHEGILNARTPIHWSLVGANYSSFLTLISLNKNIFLTEVL